MKILYYGNMAADSSSPHRVRSLEQAGHEVVTRDSRMYWPRNLLLFKIIFRVLAGPWISRLNEDVLRMAREVRPDCLWSDKELRLRPATLQTLRAMGIISVSYVIDNPFGPRNDAGWRLYMGCVPEFDLHCTQREVSVQEYRRRGARDVLKIQTAFDSAAHVPPPEGWSDKDRDREVSFIGTPYDDRADVLDRLSQSGVAVVISGSENAWRKALSPDAFLRMFREGELSGPAYTRGIWRSKINLSFLTKSNQDEVTQKSFEIVGCAGFLLAERSAGHEDRFVEGAEAAFFGSFNELVATVRRYLPDEAARQSIAEAGHRRAVKSGYDNDTQMQRVMDRVEALRSQQRNSAG